MADIETPQDAKDGDKVVRHVNELDAGVKDAQLVPEVERGDLPSVDPAPGADEVAEAESDTARDRAKDEEKVAAKRSEMADDTKDSK